jgi:hypothetical protein
MIIKNYDDVLVKRKVKPIEDLINIMAAVAQ